MKRAKNLQAFKPKARPCIEQKILCTVEKDQVKRFLDGKQRWYYTNTRPHCNLSEILLYERESRIVIGRALFASTFADDPKTIWKLTGKESAMTENEYRERFPKNERVYALQIKEPRMFANPLPLSKLGIENPPEKLCNIEL